ncbi:MAG TPA: hypothetical protein VES40_12590 [Ilumatobacteraceae bacterium]|nr:hypothetical protein [Ilumatobacteraceae bacterium]
MSNAAGAKTSVRPVPTDEEAVAIVAATEVLWPRAAVNGPAETARNHVWRFSGRWWSRPVPARRDRPYR